MKRLGLTISIGVLSLGLVACTKAGSSDKKLDEIKSDIAQIKKLLGADSQPQAPARGAAKGKPGKLGKRALANNTPMGRIERRLARMEQMIQRGAGGRNNKRRRRPGPDAKTVYSVPIAGAASNGPKHALVTIVSGFEFA